MKHLAIFIYSTGKTLIIQDPELAPNQNVDVYEEYIVRTFSLSPNDFHYMVGTNLSIEL